MADDENKERLNSEEFLDLIPHLSFAHMLQIEIRLKDGSWRHLLETQLNPNKAKVYCCTLCNVRQALQKNITVHLSGKKHQAMMQNNVKELFHPEYTYPKSVHDNSEDIGTKPVQTTNTIVKSTEKLNIENNVKSANNKKVDDKEKTVLVRNPLAGSRPLEKTSSKTDEAKINEQTEKSASITNIPEIVIIDDDDDDDEVVVETQNNGTKNNNEPPSKKQRRNENFPKLMVASISKLKENDNNNSKGKEIITKKQTNAHQNKPEETGEEFDKNKIHGFVGVEYVIKIFFQNGAPRYECGLCELNLNFNDMQNHLLGYSHRLKFCEKHFPTAIQQFRQYIVDVPKDEHYKVMIPVLQKLAEAIEKHYGLSKPFACSEKRLKSERIRVFNEVFSRPHASEKDGPTFTHVVNSKDVDKFIAQREQVIQNKTITGQIFDTIRPHFRSAHQIDSAPIVKMANEMRMHFQLSRPYHVEGPYPGPSMMGPPPRYAMQPSPYMGGQSYMGQSYMQPQPQSQLHPQRQPIVDDETHKRMVEKFLRANNKDSSHTHASSSRTQRHERNEHRRDVPRLIRSRSRSPARELTSNPHHDIWRSYCRLVDHKLDALNECFKQYKANPESHPSYKDEWSSFWRRRKTELIEIGEDYRCYDYQKEWTPYFNNRMRELYEEAFEKLKIQSREELSLPYTNEFVQDPKYHVKPLKRKPTPIEPRNSAGNLQTFIAETNTTPPRHENLIVNSQRRQPILTHSKEIAKNSNLGLEEEEKTPTFVSVLRLLTALEEHLGSLGPKIVELLTKALQAEKSGPARLANLINNENCSLLETAMEKFKGIVITGILDDSKDRALKKAITKVSTFLRNAQKELKEKSKKTVSNPPPIVNLTHNTHLIEEKIAAALTAQGATNFDRAHLEQLATVCLLLEKKKKEAAAEILQAASRNIAPTQKPLSDTLSDIMSNFSSLASKQTASTSTNASVAHKTSSNTTVSNYHSQQQYAESNRINNNNSNDNNLNSARNFGYTYSENNSSNNFMQQNNRNLNMNERNSSWPQQQQQLQQQQFQQQRPIQQNMASSFGWNQNANQMAAHFQNNANRPSMGQTQFRYN